MFSVGCIHVFTLSHAFHFFLWWCLGGNKILYQLLKILRLFPSPNLGWAHRTVYPHSSAAAWELCWASENDDRKSWFGHCLGLYLSIQGMYCNAKCATSVYFLWHTCLSIKNVANRTFLTRVLQTETLVSRLDSQILFRLGALWYITAMLPRRWAWLI